MFPCHMSAKKHVAAAGPGALLARPLGLRVEIGRSARIEELAGGRA